MGQYKEGWYRNSHGGLFYYDGTEKGDKGKDVVVGKKKVHVKNGQELSEAMIESGKFKKGMREKYREGAKEINREIDEKKKGQFKEYLDLNDKYNGTNGVSDDWYIEEARKLNIDDETIANEIYKKHNGAQSNNTSDDNIKMLLARKEGERKKTNAEKFRNMINDKTLSKEQRDFARREFDNEAKELGRYRGYEKEFAKRVGKDREVEDRWFEQTINDTTSDKQSKEFLRRAKAMKDYKEGKIGERQYRGQMSGKYYNDARNDDIREKVARNSNNKTVKALGDELRKKNGPVGLKDAKSYMEQDGSSFEVNYRNSAGYASGYMTNPEDKGEGISVRGSQLNSLEKYLRENGYERKKSGYSEYVFIWEKPKNQKKAAKDAYNEYKKNHNTKMSYQEYFDNVFKKK